MKITTFVLVLYCLHLTTSLVIYRRKPKPKLICKEESEWLTIAKAVGLTSKAGSLIANGTYFEITNSDSEDSSEESKEQVRLIERRHRRNAGMKKVNADYNEPVLIINEDDPNGNFEIHGASLTKEEKKIIQRKLRATCNALDLD
uniref:Uncharacterized protein n=1 Tax=Panagrellus redivivus TaxID=6233 RepID=A0A7E4W634_PANRE